METVILTARLPRRELALAAFSAGMVDCTVAEISRYAILRLSGIDHESAKTEATASRKPVKSLAHDMTETVDVPVSAQVSKEALEAIKSKLPDASPSTIYRYALIALSHDDSDAALEAAQRPHGGGWTKGKPRK